jgi:hypothetical protein
MKETYKMWDFFLLKSTMSVLKITKNPYMRPTFFVFEVDVLDEMHS